MRNFRVAWSIQSMSPRSYASVVAFQKGMQMTVNATSIRLKYRYVIWYGVTKAGVNNLEMRRLEVINSMTLEICMTKNCTPILITVRASLKLMSLKDGRSCGYLWKKVYG